MNETPVIDPELLVVLLLILVTGAIVSVLLR